MVKESTSIEIKNVDGISKLTGLHNIKPLKILSPETHNKVCHIVTTNYGGGFVQGDEIKLNINSGKDTCTLLSSQANARAFKSSGNVGSKYILNSTIGNNSLFVQLNDPLVLQKNSDLEQHSSYHLKNDSVLFLLDCVEGGRVHTGELFSFKRFYSETNVYKNDVPYVIDRFIIEPDKIDCSSPAVFMNHTSFINIYLVGQEDDSRVRLLEEHLDSEVEIWAKKNNQKPEALAVSDRVNEYAYLVRASSVELGSLLQFIRNFAQVFKEKELLGFNPYDRKY